MGLVFRAFNQNSGLRAEFDPPLDETAGGIADYLRNYLVGLDCEYVAEETQYIDRDYHDMFTAFYGTLPRPILGVCRRLHFFNEEFGELNDQTFQLALHDLDKADLLRKAYLGFIAVRPAPVPPFGRSVLAHFPGKDHEDGFTRILDCASNHKIHLCGLELSVRGVQWQQQDGNVAACATVALWSVLQQVSRLDGVAHLSTSDVTRLTTSRSVPNGRRFPPGLSIAQLCEGIEEAGLHPVLFDGGLQAGEKSHEEFSCADFRDIAAILVRSRIPCIVACKIRNPESESVIRGALPDHAVVLVGYQKKEGRLEGRIASVAESNDVFYLHDDNFGPGVRHELEERDGVAVLRPRRRGDTGLGDRNGSVLVPSSVICAFPKRMRFSPPKLLELARSWREILFEVLKGACSVTHDTAIVLTQDYLADWFPKTEEGAGLVVAVNDKIHYPSRFIGVVRILVNEQRMFDVLYDTTMLPGANSCLGIVKHYSISNLTKLYEAPLDQRRLCISSGVPIVGRS